MNDNKTQSTQTLVNDDARDELNAEELNQVGGGYPCSYLGVYDYTRMQSYESRNYSC